MATNLPNESFVKIQIASDKSGKPKEFFLTRFQFEVLFFSIPVVLLWGFASTVILFKILYLSPSPPAVVTNVSTPSIHLGQQLETTKNHQDSLSRPAALIAKNETSTIGYGEKDSRADADKDVVAYRSFKVDDIFHVDLKVSQNSDAGVYTLDLAMQNLTGSEESGVFWVSVLAFNSLGEKIWLTPMPDVKINDMGQALSPERGQGFSFRNFRRSTFELAAPGVDVVKFDEVVIGFQRNGNSPAIAKVNLNSR